MEQSKICLLSLSVIVLLSLLFLPGIKASEKCDEWIAKAVSVQGSVQARIGSKKNWIPVEIHNTFCNGDMIRVQERSRAAIVLVNDTIIRLDQKTTITFKEFKKGKSSLIDIITGALHFISRAPRVLKLSTPFVNGTIEGTEFFVRVSQDHTIFSVFEGTVVAANQMGSLKLVSGQSAIAKADQAPAAHVVVRPMDGVHWALYYPPVINFRISQFAGHDERGSAAILNRSLRHYLEGDLKKAFSIIHELEQGLTDPGSIYYRASLLLAVGRVEQAEKAIEEILNMPGDKSSAYALQSIIELTQNNNQKALALAQKAINANPDSATPYIAHSYASQASFDLKGALTNLLKAVEHDPGNSFAWARLAEIRLSSGDLDKSLIAAKKAAELNPDLAHTQSVLGFAYLAQSKTLDSTKVFERSITMDQAAPLPRLGLGLTKIRQGRIMEGRREIEIAASLDPGNALVRSYLGKAYYEEKRTGLAETQFKLAEKFDPLDPTPFFYGAIQMQSMNRPVQALQSIQKSINLNDNRSVYRSKLLLDSDLAARSSSLARIYNDLGFEHLALLEGWKSVSVDPGNYSAHRLLADSYAALPRHEIARVSELLQSQLLQPINITPVQPSLGESDLLILEGSGPGDLAFNEFNPLFNRNRIALQISGVAGGNDTIGDEITLSGVHDNFSISAGQFHHETEGFRANNDLTQDIFNVFVQYSLGHKTSIQAEYRHKEIEKGDLPLRFDPDNFLSNLRQEDQTKTARLGFRHSFSPGSDFIASFMSGNDKFESRTNDIDISLGPFTTQLDIDLQNNMDHYLIEAQHLYRSEGFDIVSGIGHYDREIELTNALTYQPEAPPIFENSKSIALSNLEQTTLYLYSTIKYPENITWTVGASNDFYEGPLLESTQFNPKAGVTWSTSSGTAIRAAVFRVLSRSLVSGQTIEPTQISGFNQFFDDVDGTDSWRYGLAVDQKISEDIHGGAEITLRELEVPYTDIITDRNKQDEWNEQFLRAYLYWSIRSCLTLDAEYQYERFDRVPESPGVEDLVELKTHRVPVGINFFHPSGFRAGMKATYVDQEGEFGNSRSGVVSGEDEFVVVDASVSYRLPRRMGTITVEGKNLFDKEFKFQDTDPANPGIYPERLVLVKFTLSF